jgi:RecB family endonuclease NucS
MYGKIVLFNESGKFEKGERIYLGDVKHKDESWLRDTLFDNPEILPTDDIDSTFGPLIPVCKELRTDAGPIDAVFINERGRLTIVECKLWKNPQARRAERCHRISLG